MNLDPGLFWSAIPQHEKISALSALEAECNKHGIWWGNPQQRQELVRWRLYHLQNSAYQMYKRGMPASASPAFASNTPNNLPSSADAGSSGKAAALAPSLARSAEQAGAGDPKGALLESTPEEHNSAAVGRDRGIRPMRPSYHK